MKLHFFFVCFIALALSSCSSKVQKPEPFLDESQMVNLLTEMQLTESRLQQLQAKDYNIDSTRLYTQATYSALFKKYGLTQKSLEANLRYYTYYSRDMEDIFTKVYENIHRLDSLSQQKNLAASKVVSEN